MGKEREQQKIGEARARVAMELILAGKGLQPDATRVLEEVAEEIIKKALLPKDLLKNLQDAKEK